MFDWLYKGLGYMLSWFSGWTGSYVIALLFYALIFKIVFLPFSIKQQKNQIAMAKLTPKIELIRAKYRGRTDQITMRKQQEEIMDLQQKEGYSPLSGCLPLLIQLPLIIFLYNVIRNPLSYLAMFEQQTVVDLYNVVYSGTEGFVAKTLENFSSIDQIVLAGAIKNADPILTGPIASTGADISLIPNFTLWGIDLSAVPVFLGITVLVPVIAAALQWLAMFISRKCSGNANQLQQGEATAQANMSMKIMDLIMPLMTLWLTFSFSALMGVYWIFQSVLAIIQTLILSKLMPIPKFTEEEIKAIRKAQKAQEKAQKAIIKTQPKYRSLHYIDEDDYDELPTLETKSSKGPKGNPEDKPEIKD